MSDNEPEILEKLSSDMTGKLDIFSPAPGEPLSAGEEMAGELFESVSSQADGAVASDEDIPAASWDAAEGIAQLSDRIAGLEKLFETKILHTEHEEKIVDQMHGELQKYKDDMYSQLVRPILLDIIEMRDSILRVAAVYLDKPEGERAIPVKTFSMYAADIQEILEKNSIEIFRSEEKTDFVPLRHKVIKKTATGDQSLHRKVAESLSDGYNYNGKIISAEKIAVYSYEETQAADNSEENIQNG